MTGKQHQVRLHDFRRTETLERVHLHTISVVLETFARLGSAPLSTLLRQPCSLTLESLEQVTWSDLVGTFEDDLHFVLFSMPPLPGRSLAALPARDALAIVDLRLAGNGEDDYPERALTEIEQELLGPVFDGLLGELAKALVRLQATTPVVERQEPSIQFVSVASANEACLSARFLLAIGNRPVSHLSLCLPLQTVRGVVEAMHQGPGSTHDDAPDAVAAAVRSRLDEVPIDLVLQFPSFDTTPETLLSLAVGDELHLGLPTDRPLELRAEGMLVARATIGRSGPRKACSITEEVFT